MIKDREQKRLAARFCAAQGIIPFLEVVVRSHAGLEETPVNITDIDVLGLDLGRSNSVQRTIFDCKTGSRLSAINRALWAAGLKSLVGADRAFVIQKKEVLYTHKLSANELSVHIHSEETFSRYASSISLDFGREVSYLDDLDTWDSFVGISQNQPLVSEMLWFSTTQAALESSGPKGIRLGLSALIKSSPELDPRRPAHRLLFGNFISAFLVFICFSTMSLKEIFQFSMEKEDFEQTLRYFIWEGRENYVNRRNMKLAIDKVRGEAYSAEFDLPEWARFVNSMRSFLDAPEALLSLPFLTKEVAFRSASKSIKKDADERIKRLFQSNVRARQFIFATANYLVHAARLPREFSKNFEEEVNSLLIPADLFSSSN